MPAGLSPFGKAVLTSSFYFFYISYVTLPSVECREEWYVRRFELREFFFFRIVLPLVFLLWVRRLVRSLHFFLSFRASHRFLPRFSPYSSLSLHQLLLRQPAFGASAFGALPS